jgi:plastocyanin
MSLRRSTIGLSLLAVTLALAGGACGSSSSSPSAPTTSANVTISILGDRASQSYSPNPTTVRVGQTVAWQNNDSIAHNATQDAGAFASITVNAGGITTPITMSTAGTFTYHCTIHPGMVGTLTVQ